MSKQISAIEYQSIRLACSIKSFSLLTQFVEIKLPWNIPREIVVVEGHGFDPPVANSRILSGNRSGKLVVVQVEEPELDPPLSNVFRQLASELVSSKVGKDQLSEPEVVGNRPSELVRIQIEVFY